ncbi:hypothetical protein [Actinoplanes sp. GCM10030250]|uniref:hypothetical protein n=1 Tax=Actinoplanes sp. GCM10030250 TaxID=3273376 RepID=UPI00361270D2
MAKRARNLLVITNESREIVAAQVEDRSAGADTTTVILPADPGHTLYIVRDVPAEIYNIADPAEFKDVATVHFNSEYAKLTRTSAAELGFTLPARDS